jgi:hypothetical protein
MELRALIGKERGGAEAQHGDPSRIAPRAIARPKAVAGGNNTAGRLERMRKLLYIFHKARVNRKGCNILTALQFYKVTEREGMLHDK